MGLLSSDDLIQMQNDLAEVRGDHEISIVIRRGEASSLARPDYRHSIPGLADVQDAPANRGEMLRFSG